ncbi:hypothetical protein HNY73_022937 [Argiope bruennichi]|uniref:Uncharacterized protein n=1 Tax=Argiope bruennichi TaxID=94029 RepID=A0A8T0E3L9_ARGBR|nr:hypothetical protein HNY73_022937 [Argiope bruennichi]
MTCWHVAPLGAPPIPPPSSPPCHLSAPHPVVTTLLLLLKHTLVVNIQPEGGGDKVFPFPHPYLSANKPLGSAFVRIFSLGGLCLQDSELLEKRM